MPEPKFPKIHDLPPELLSIVDATLAGAACAGMSPLFDDTVHGETKDERESRHHKARAVCTRCPVLWDCLYTAKSLPADQRQGVWGRRTYHHGKDTTPTMTPKGHAA